MTRRPPSVRTAAERSSESFLPPPSCLRVPDSTSPITNEGARELRSPNQNPQSRSQPAKQRRPNRNPTRRSRPIPPINQRARDGAPLFSFSRNAFAKEELSLDIFTIQRGQAWNIRTRASHARSAVTSLSSRQGNKLSTRRKVSKIFRRDARIAATNARRNSEKGTVRDAGESSSMMFAMLVKNRRRFHFNEPEASRRIVESVLKN